MLTEVGLESSDFSEIVAFFNKLSNERSERTIPEKERGKFSTFRGKENDDKGLAFDEDGKEVFFETEDEFGPGFESRVLIADKRS